MYVVSAIMLTDSCTLVDIKLKYVLTTILPTDSGTLGDISLKVCHNHATTYKRCYVS